MRQILVLAICASLMASGATMAAPTATDAKTPKEAIEQAEAAQASSHTWVWWAAGGLAAAVAIGLAAKHGGDNGTGGQSQACSDGVSGDTGVPPGGLAVNCMPVGP